MEKYIDHLEKKWGDLKPFVKLFQTEFGNYLYDPGTNKLLRCNDVVFAEIQEFQKENVRTAIDNLLNIYKRELVAEGLREIVDAIEEENILLTDPKRIYFDSLHFSKLEDEITHNLGQLILEVTEKCNLRCSYCVYNDIVTESRNHGNRNMPLSTALKAIDYIGAHSSKRQRQAVTFYGGEPLLRFQFIVKCVEYTHKVFGKNEVTFALTTNGTTVTREIAQFLARENFSMTVSIDGPKEIHDDYRVYKNGKGTFEQAMRGLRALIEAYGERADRQIYLSMVYAPPFSSKRLDKIASLWKHYPWIGKISANITYPHPGSIPIERKPAKEHLLIEDKSVYEWATDLYFDGYSQKQEINPLVKLLIDQSLVRVFRRPIFDIPNNSIHLNGCCVPGGRKIYITTDGSIALCERVHTSPPCLGHIDTGIDFDSLKRVFVDEYAAKSLKRCASCWAHRLCGICYADVFSNQQYDDKRKSSICEGVVQAAEEQLKLYSRLLHVNPEGLNFLANMEVR